MSPRTAHAKPGPTTTEAGRPALRRSPLGPWLRVFWLLVGVGLGLTPLRLAADGMVYSRALAAPTEIPDQRALIHYSNGVETLVIDTSFKGVGTNFAWVVPFPSAPKIEPATTGLFATLQTVLQDELIHSAGGYALLFGLGGLFVFSFVWQRRRGGPFGEVLALWFFALFAAAVTQPAGMKAGGRASHVASNEVELLARQTVGAFDTVTLASKDGQALLTWLQTEGFAVPTNHLPAIQAYAREGWVFVASRVHAPDLATHAARVHPLSFTFKTDRAVYPLRLTGIDARECQIDLYVFGERRAAAPPFQVERCALTHYPTNNSISGRRYGNTVPIVHPLLRQLAAHSPVVTKLTARLTPDQMRSDVYPQWLSFQEHRALKYSQRGAILHTLDLLVPVLVVALLVYYLARPMRVTWASPLRKACLWTLLLSLAAGLPLYSSLPQVPVVLVRVPHIRNQILHQELHRLLLEAVRDSAGSTAKPGNGSRPDITWVRSLLAPNSPLLRDFRPDQRLNVFTGLPWREEDSPGNYILRQTTHGIGYCWYDLDGGEHALPPFEQVP